MTLSAFAVNCSLKSGGAPSSTDLLIGQALDRFAGEGVGGSRIRAADHDIRPGVTSDEGDGDAWPGIRERILAADILLIGTPIWLGQPSSVCKRVLERMDAFLSERDGQGRMASYGRVACVAVVGNEDGAHHCSAEIFQALNDVGFSLAANAVTYWVGEAMHGTDYKDKDQPVGVTAAATDMMVRNAVHLARLLRDDGYPPQR